MKFLTQLLMVLICALSQQSCSSLNLQSVRRNAVTKDAERNILGRWYMVHYQNRDSRATRPSIEYEFTDDGRFQYRTFGTTYQGNWKISGTQLHQVWMGFEGLEGKTIKSEIFILSKSRLDLENLKKGRDAFYRNPKTKDIPVDY